MEPKGKGRLRQTSQVALALCWLVSVPIRVPVQNIRTLPKITNLPIVSIVVPFGGLPYRILIIYLVKPKKGTAMETIGTLLLS